MQNPANYATTYAGWDFANVWSAPSAGYYPQLYGVNYVLRVDPANALRTYGDANPALTYTYYGLHTGDTSAILAGLSLSTAATTTSNAGSYAITAGGSVISTAGQAYRLIQTPAALTVTPRSITVTADAKSRTYGDAYPALTYQVGGSGLANGDSLSGALATSATTASNVGVYGINQGSLAASGNYALNYTSADLTVGQRAITVTADAKSRAYGDANPALTYQVGGSGLANGDSLSGALTTSATVASNVGTYGINQGSLAASGNYALNYTSADLTVGQRAITVTADAKSRAYGDANPALTYQVGGSGLANGDSLSGALTTSATVASNVGTYGINQGSLAASGNYALNYTSAAYCRPARDHRDGRCEEPGLWRCQSGADLSGRRLRPRQRRHAVWRADDVGDNFEQCRHLRHQPGYAGGLRQLRAELYEQRPDRRPARDHGHGRCQEPGLWRRQSGADLSGRRLRPRQRRHLVGCAGDVGDDSQQCRCLRHQPGTLAASANYALNYASANLTVTQRAITVTADAKSRGYGDANPALTYQVSGSGLANGDSCRERWRRRRQQPAMSVPTASIREHWLPQATTR